MTKTRRIPARRRPERGVALVIVIGVLATLILIAVPFSISMLHHERGARVGLADTQARLAAEGARAFAVHQLYATNDFVEGGQGARAPYQDPYVDARDESVVDVTRADRFDLKLRPPDDWGREFRTADPKGPLWGVSVEDEQGKINRLTAPDHLLQNLREVLDPDGKGLRRDLTPFLTEYSLRPCRWIYPMNYRGDVVETDQKGKVIWTGIGCDDFSRYGLHSTVRLTLGGSVLETEVSEVRARGFNVGGGQGMPAGYRNPAAVIEVEQRHPVNMNAAPIEVLIAQFVHLPTKWDRNGRVEEEVGLNEARAIARTLYGRAVGNWSAFQQAIASVPNLSASQRNWVVVNAKSPTNTFFRGRGTLPVCFRSEDVFGIEAWGAVNDPAGNVMARRGFREVVELTPPETMAWRTESQVDFERTYSTFPTGPSPYTYPFGYPFGSKILTSPADVFTGAVPDGSRNGTAEVRMVPALDPWIGGQVVYREHYLDQRDGLEVKGSASIPAAQILVKAGGATDIQAGGLDLWVKMKSLGGDVYFFDAAKADWENRLACFYRSATNELILRACDATIERAAAEIRMPFSPKPDVWYHVSGHWKGTKFAHLALLLDGMSHPNARFTHVDETGRETLAKLNADLDRESTQVKIVGPNVASFPQKNGVIEIGQEAIAYEDLNGGDLQKAVRGARGTGIWITMADPKDPTRQIQKYVGKPHVKDATVAVFGYSNQILNATVNLRSLSRSLGINIPPMVFDRLTTGGGNTSNAFGKNTYTSVYRPPDPADPQDPGGIDAAVTEVPVDEGGAQDFPKLGYLKIDNEAVYYAGWKKGKPVVDPFTGKMVTPDLFFGCRRGELGTNAAIHSHGSPVEMYAIGVSGNQNYLDPTIVQIEDEWFGPVSRSTAGYFTGVVVSGIPVPLLRGFAGTGTRTHGQGLPVIPLFAVRDPECGGSDRVTILQSNAQKEEATIRQVRDVSGVHLVGFDAFTQKEYTPSPPDARVLKWPSGELLSDIPGAFSVGTSWNGSSGQLDGILDEVKGTTSTKGGFAAGAAIDPSQKSITVNSGGGMANDGGVLKIGDEYVGYARRNRDTLDPVARGFLDSPGGAPDAGHANGVHDAEERAFYLNYLPVGALAGPAGPDDRVLPLVGGAQNFQGNEGFVLIDDEVVGFTSHGGGGLLQMPGDDAGHGIFRGAFGTAAAAHGANAVVYGLPFRYWGFYRDDAADDRMPYWQGAMTRPGAVWRRLSWISDTPDDLVNFAVRARFNGKPGWETTPTNRPGGIYAWRSGPASLNVTADTIEVRVYFEYLKGAYQRPAGGRPPPDAWKATPVFHQLSVEYERASITRFHEEK